MRVVKPIILTPTENEVRRYAKNLTKGKYSLIRPVNERGLVEYQFYNRTIFINPKNFDIQTSLHRKPLLWATKANGQITTKSTVYINDNGVRRREPFVIHLSRLIVYLYGTKWGETIDILMQCGTKRNTPIVARRKENGYGVSCFYITTRRLLLESIRHKRKFKFLNKLTRIKNAA